MAHRWFAAHAVAGTLAAAAVPAMADPAADKAAIIERFQDWTAAFNARNADGVCDLFVPDLVYTIPELPRGTRDTMCANLAKLLARSDLHVSYADPDIHDIIVSGDLAVVRLTWTLTTRIKSDRDVSTEEGMDVFHRQPDGKWSIIRFIAFTTAPNALLGK